MELGFLGMGGVALDATQQEQVAIGSPTAPEMAAGQAADHLPRTAQMLFWISLGYLVVFVFHVITY